jgi:hypothetical protein
VVARGLLLYRHQEKSLKWFRDRGLQLPRAQIQGGRVYTERAGTFEDYLKTRFHFTKVRGYQLLNSVEFILKLTAPKVNGNEKIVYSETPILPSNEWQIRPLLTDLKHDAERVHVWNEVTNSGEKKITAELVQRKVNEFKAWFKPVSSPQAG